MGCCQRPGQRPIFGGAHHIPLGHKGSQQHERRSQEEPIQVVQQKVEQRCRRVGHAKGGKQLGHCLLHKRQAFAHAGVVQVHNGPDIN